MKELWNYFDCIRCINLSYRKDRYESSKKIFDKYDIPVEYFITEKDKEGGEAGCFRSHIQIIKEAYEKGCNNVLIFEDDIEVSPYLNEQNLKQCIDFMKNNDWDLFFLGMSPSLFNTFKKVEPNIYKGHYVLTHAYTINRKFMKKLINMDYIDIPIDITYMYNKNSYAFYPNLFNQSLFTSDLKNINQTQYYVNKIIDISFRYNINFTKIIIIIFIVITYLLTLFLFDVKEKYKWLMVILLLIIFVLIYDIY